MSSSKGSCSLKVQVFVRVQQGSCRPGEWPALSLADLLCQLLLELLLLPVQLVCLLLLHRGSLFPLGLQCLTQGLDFLGQQLQQGRKEQ